MMRQQVPLFIAALAGIAYGHNMVVLGVVIYVLAWVAREKENA